MDRPILIPGFETSDRPIIRKKGRVNAKGINRQLRAAGHIGPRGFVTFRDFSQGRHPPNDPPIRYFDSAFRAVLRFETILQHFKLQRSHGSQQGNVLMRAREFKRLREPFLEKLFKSFAETFELGRAGVVDEGEANSFAFTCLDRVQL